MMISLSFRVVYVYKDDPIAEECFASHLKVQLKNSKYRDVTVNPLKLRTHDYYDEINECAFQVHAKCIENSRYRNIYHYYKELRSKWNYIVSELPAILVFSENYSFSRSFENPQDITLTDFDISFGTLPYNNGEFHEYLYMINGTEDFEGNFVVETRQIEFNSELHEIKIHAGVFDKRKSCQRSFVMILPYHNIQKIFVNTNKESRDVFFTISDPPIVFENKYIMGSEGPILQLYRTCSLYFLKKSAQTGFINMDLHKIFGACNVIQVSFTPGDSIIQEKVVNQIRFQMKKPVHYTFIESIEKIASPFPNENLFDFDCTYLLHAILRRNFTAISQCTGDDIESELVGLCDKRRLEHALKQVFAAVVAGKIVNVWHTLRKMYSYYLNKDDITFNHYMPPEYFKVCRVTITPTRELFWLPEPIFGNRILRNFNPDYTLRVIFRDDNHKKLTFTATHSNEDFLNQAVRLPMLRGIKIGRREYEFLGWGNSQIREHGVWMYAEDENGNTAQCIRDWMGDFSYITSVPKYMARMGQCFSQTEETISISSSHCFTDDIEKGSDPSNEPYCFSDGIGKISPACAKKVQAALGHDKLCSAFQIRYGGYKGMLVIDPTLEGERIVFRRSMNKFSSPNATTLEIAKISKPTLLKLNRPFITLLNGLGIKSKVFVDLQETYLQSLSEALTEEKKACKFLHSKTFPGVFDYQDLSRSGISFIHEPFFFSLILALFKHIIAKIKAKASIPIDSSKGRNMLGVLDEARVLNYGEVFVQYTEDPKNRKTTKNTRIVEGEVVVTKNPCLLPGDVRKFWAVDVPELHHIVDCIVFPQKGQRPHPNEMAGSDLDGDEYAVLWDTDLIFSGENEKPGHFPAAIPKQNYIIAERELVKSVRNFIEKHPGEDINDYLDLEYTIDELRELANSLEYSMENEQEDDMYDLLTNMIEDKNDKTLREMITFLVNFIQNDEVGHIANAHLAQADRYDIFSEECIAIAEKFSLGIDSSKTGVFQHLDPVERPTKFPDFMMEHNKPSYPSNKALGQMFRRIQIYENLNTENSISYQDIQIDPDLMYPGWQTYEDSAIKSKNRYNRQLKMILQEYGLQNEADVFSCAFTSLHSWFHEHEDYAEIERMVISCIKHLAEKTSNEFLREFIHSGQINRLDTRILQKASAWYIVTYRDNNTEFLSFPWIVSNFLANIKQQKNRR